MRGDRVECDLFETKKTLEDTNKHIEVQQSEWLEMQKALDTKMETIRLKFNQNCDAMGDWTKYVNRLKDQVEVLEESVQILEGKVESMTGRLCRCGEGVETAESVERPASPALTYEGSKASYHTLSVCLSVPVAFLLGSWVCFR